MTSHAFKKVVATPSPFSFVQAVTERGDLWWIKGTPRANYEDLLDYAAMVLIECGEIQRAYADTADLDAYPAVTPASFNVFWSAITEDYDGAPDSNYPHGVGNTRFEAYADLAEQIAERAS